MPTPPYVFRRLATLFAAAAVLTLSAATAATAEPSTPPADGLEQTLDANQREAAGNAVLDTGHVDIGPRYRDGKWTVAIHDDSAVPAVWRQPAATVLRVRDPGRQQVPDDRTYDFLGEKPGTEVYVVPQTQQPDVVWIGWNTQDPGVMAAIDRGVTLSLRGVQGPGRVAVYLQSGNLGAPQVLWNSAGVFPQPLWVETNTHTHANWVFGKPGIYLLALTVSADLANGSTVSADTVLRFAVGDATSADQARTAAFTAPLASGSPRARAEIGEADEDSSPVLLLTIAGGVAVIVVLVVVFGIRGAAARRRAEREREEGR